MTTETSFQVAEADLIRDDIEGYLRKHEHKDMLRFLTCGSVDDGKSTLIGRLLYDSKMIYEDQLAAVMKDSAIHGTTDEDFDPALLTDGLKAEREQGITIDVAYRYFSTDKRNFIICDAPGHEQYTRNMATGASHCDVAIVLIDARHGILPQTRRHSFIATLLGIKHLVVAINKMDIVDYSEAVYDQIRQDYQSFAAKLDVNHIHFMPISALKGDNVVDRSENMPWFQGEPLLPYLENLPVASDRNLIDFRFPVQYVLRPNLNFRGFSGTIASGTVRKGDEVMIMPSGKRTKVASIVTYEGELEEAFAPQAVTITTEDEVDCSRGDMICRVHNLPQTHTELEATIVWMDEKSLKPGANYLLKTTSNLGPSTVTALRYKFDVNTLKRQDADELHLNDIGRAVIHLHRPMAYDAYTRNRNTGCFVLIDRVSNATVAAGMILDRDPNELYDDTPRGDTRSQNINSHASQVTHAERAARLDQTPSTIWLTGLPKSGKSSIAYALERKLFDQGKFAVVLDGENLRGSISADLGFSASDRRENVRRAAATAKLLNDNGITAIVATVSPYANDRANARTIIGGDRFMELHVDAPLEVCKARDTNGLYAKAESGEIEHVSGVTAPYEAPESPDLTIDTTTTDINTAVTTILSKLTL